MPRISSVYVLSALLVLAPLSAKAQHGKVGLWSVTSTMTMANMPKIPPEDMAQMKKMGIKLPAGGQSFTTQQCMTAAEVARDAPPKMGRENAGCEWSQVHATGAGMSADMVCKGEMTGRGQVHIAYQGPEHYSGDYAFHGVTGGQPTDMKTVFKGDWIGPDCGKVKPHMPQ